MRRLLFFGTFNPDYPRNRWLKQTLASQGFEIDSLNIRGRGWSKYFRLYWRLKKTSRSYDAIFVGFPGHLSVIIARLASAKLIFFDAFISLYDTYVNDRQSIPGYSWRASWYRWLDRRACLYADTVIVDTQQHAEYFSSYFNMTAGKIKVIPVSTDLRLFQPKTKQPDGQFTVFWFGKYSPLHNVRYILEAAREMLTAAPDIRFELLGRGADYADARDWAEQNRLTNVTFLEAVKYQDLPERINASDLCLGIFGHSQKVDRVVPNKISAYLACGRFIITRRSIACRDMLAGADIAYVDGDTASELVAAILNFRQGKGAGFYSEANRQLSLKIEKKARADCLAIFSSEVRS